MMKRLDKCTGIVKWFAQRFLDDIPYSAEMQQQIQNLAEHGVIVYVHRAKSSLLHLALARIIDKYKLPPIVATSLDKYRARTFSAVIHSASGAIELFLNSPNTVVSPRKQNADDMQILVELQHAHHRPIYLVPHVLILGIRAHQRQRTTTDMIFGSRQEPGFLRMLVRILMCYRHAKWEACEPLNLQTVIAENTDKNDEAVARQARFLLTKSINDLERTYYGPSMKSHARLQTDTLRDRDLQDYATQITEQTGVPAQILQKKMENFYNEIHARFDIDIIRLFDLVLGFVWNRIYDGLSWRKTDIEKIRKASKKGPLIVVPSHKSHLDYLVMSQIFYWEGLMLPHIAAGTNLSFFPLGAIFRRGGAYFIRRSFKGDPLYPQVVRAYIKRLLKEGFTQEFFIEGGRSRTGKTLPPKLGLLGIMTDCIIQGKIPDAQFVPASISYDKLVEASEYRRELEGGEKTTESNKELLGSTRILRKKYGRVYVTFGEPISFKDFMQERGLDHQKDLVKALAHHIMHGINECSTVTPSSLIAIALFGSNRRTLSYAQLMWRIKKIVHYIDSTETMPTRHDIKRALELLTADHVLSIDKAGRSNYYRIPESSALSLDYYKNNIIHHFVADSIIATAFIALSGKNRRKRVKLSALSEATRLLSQTFKYEFVYPVNMPFQDLFQQRIDRAIQNKLIFLDSEWILLSESREANLQFNFSARLLANFVDAYWVCLQKYKLATKKSHNQKSLVLKLLEYLREAHINGSSDCPEIENKSMPENVLQLVADYGIAKLETTIRLLENAHYNR